MYENISLTFIEISIFYEHVHIHSECFRQPFCAVKYPPNRAVNRREESRSRDNYSRECSEPKNISAAGMLTCSVGKNDLRSSKVKRIPESRDTRRGS